MSYLPTSEKDTVLISRPLYHSSVLTGEFIVSLCAGANIVFSSEPFQPQSILELIDRYSVTVFGSTPTLITLLSRFIRRPENSTVNKLTISGECLTDGMAKSIRSAFPKADIYCGYGLSEASPRVAYLPPNLFDSKPTSAGIALPSVKLKIIRENGSDASLCEIGEVVVKGPNVMTGYLDDAERTKKVLKNGWLRTGDVGYVDNDRMLYIKGRKDDMIIRAGMNIYPAEIENALSKDERFHDVQVYGYSKNGTQEIAMSVSGDFKSTDQIMRACRELLPNYQLPSKIEIADDVERLSSGKRRRKKET
jgi:acyl-CoA synthetase (AMP-forming)/AMP-acid ligase II